MTKSDLLQEGTYRGVVTEWGLSKSSVKGTLYVDFRLRLTHRAAAGGGWDELPVPVVRSLPVYLTVRSMDLAVGELRQLGFEDEDPRKLAPGHEGAHDFTGAEVEVSLAREEYADGQGTPRCQERLRVARGRPTRGRRW
jgi:hypothetical protein